MTVPAPWLHKPAQHPELHEPAQDPELARILSFAFPGCIDDPTSEFMQQYALLRLRFKEAQAQGDRNEARRLVDALNYLSLNIPQANRWNAWYQLLTNMVQRARAEGHVAAARHLEKWVSPEELGSYSYGPNGWLEDEQGYRVADEPTAHEMVGQMLRQMPTDDAAYEHSAQSGTSQAPAAATASGEPLRNALGGIDQEIKDLEAAYVDAQRKGDSDKAAQLQIQLQEKRNQKQILFAMVSSMIQSEHGISENIIKNIK